MQPKMRPYQGEDDFWRLRSFLRQVYLANDRRERSWQVYRLDYARWHAVENVEKYHLEDTYFLWETPGGLAAALNPEGKGEVYLQVHPELETPELIEEMISVAEECLAVPGVAGRRRVSIYTDQHNRVQVEALRRRGYLQGEWPEYRRYQPLATPILPTPLVEGYTLRPLGDQDELPRRSWASWRAFHPDNPPEDYQGWEWYRNVQRCPLYRRDLDLVVAAPGGEIAGFCTVWFDDVTRTGAFEPVGVVPDHQRHGLGKALMLAGLQRLQRLGATQATVGAYSARANALYASAGFIDYDQADCWEKDLD